MTRTTLLTLLAAVAVALVLAGEAQAMYHPRLGRFMQRDPAGHADGMSRYGHAHSSPGIWVDPYGSAAARPNRPTKNGGAYRQRWSRPEDTTFNDIAKGTLPGPEACPRELRLPKSAKNAVDDAWRRTLSTGQEQSGAFTLHSGEKEIVVWGPIGPVGEGPGRHHTIPSESVPPKYRGAIRGDYHTHIREGTSDMPLDVSWSAGDFSGFINDLKCMISILKNCLCTRALVRTRATRAPSSWRDMEWSPSGEMGKWDEKTGLTPPGYDDKPLGSDAKRFGFCYYKKCREGQHVLDLVEGQ